MNKNAAQRAVGRAGLSILRVRSGLDPRGDSAVTRFGAGFYKKTGKNFRENLKLASVRRFSDFIPLQDPPSTGNNSLNPVAIMSTAIPANKNPANRSTTFSVEGVSHNSRVTAK